ncbi:4Fe-4S dicluster domain-containing protein, partial [Candidatus Bipolaricaulota bacterium]|nr:4Fe-4S dicluster domain-containing protein [Candidatus Bipolaricaulota bacterium]
TCTKTCPQDLEVMDFVNDAIRGDIGSVAELSFDCIQCGLCAARCPAEIPHHHVAQLARRIHGKYQAPDSEHLEERVEEIQGGKFDEELEELVNLPKEDLEERYENREIEE